jgi:hypothetical protein
MTQEWLDNPRTVRIAFANYNVGPEVRKLKDRGRTETDPRFSGTLEVYFAPNGHLNFRVIFDTNSSGLGVGVQLYFVMDTHHDSVKKATKVVYFYDDGTHSNYGALADGWAVFTKSRGEVRDAQDLRVGCWLYPKHDHIIGVNN